MVSGAVIGIFLVLIAAIVLRVYLARKWARDDWAAFAHRLEVLRRFGEMMIDAHIKTAKERDHPVNADAIMRICDTIAGAMQRAAQEPRMTRAAWR